MNIKNKTKHPAYLPGLLWESKYWIWICFENYQDLQKSQYIIFNDNLNFPKGN